MTDTQQLADHVLAGMTGQQKALSSAWFYDDEGSRLFQRIMALPEYYLTRAEHELLREKAGELLDWLNPGQRPLDLIELGSGDGAKTITLCQALHERGVECVYRPIDVSEHALAELSRRFGEQLSQVAIEPFLGDYLAHWPKVESHRRQVAMLLGSNLGNFEETCAVELLKRLRSQLQPGDSLVLGLDLVKDPHMIQAAYDDSMGVTAAFNINLLRRLNRELGMDFDTSRFRHFASYCPLQGVMRSFLVSGVEQTVRSSVLNREFHFDIGETIYTEQSQKYTLQSINRLAAMSGFCSAHTIVNERYRYALAIWRRPGDESLNGHGGMTRENGRP